MAKLAFDKFILWVETTKAKGILPNATKELYDNAHLHSHGS